MSSVTLLPRTINALAAQADVSVPTVRRRLTGQPLRPSCAARLDKAARELGVELPPLASSEAAANDDGPHSEPPPAAA